MALYCTVFDWKQKVLPSFINSCVIVFSTCSTTDKELLGRWSKLHNSICQDNIHGSDVGFPVKLHSLIITKISEVKKARIKRY